MGEQKRRESVPGGKSRPESPKAKVRGGITGHGYARTWLWPALSTAGLLMLLALGGDDVIQAAVPWLLGLAGVAVLVQFLRGRLRTLIGMPTLAVLLFMAVFGVSTFFAVSGKFAMKEYSKLLLAFAGYVLLSCYLSDDEAKRPARMRGLLFGIAAATAVIGLVSIDGTLGTLFSQLLSPLTESFLGRGGVEINTRITSILGNPNVFAGVIGIGVFTSLALVGASESPKWRRIGVFLLELNAMSFLLAFSMGACLAIACGFALFLLAGEKGKRGGMLLLMGEVLVVTLGFSFAIFPSLDGKGFLPLLLTAVACVVALALDQFVAPRVMALLAGKGKILTVAACVLVAAVAGLLTLSVTLTGGAELGAGESLRRAAYPEPGQYTLAIEGSGELNVTIESQDKRETVIHSSTVLYSGSAQGAEFTVPDESLVVYFNLSTPSGASLEKAAWTGPSGEGNLPLDYLLLPGFISNRLQGLFANQNAIQRFAFFSDGLKLFAKSPIIGNGIGGFENGVTSVQDFYYTTSYVHNHYIQALCDAGILGLASFLFLLGAMAWTLIRARRECRAANWLIPGLMGCLLFMAVHAGVEVVFSHAPYLTFGFAAFALMGVQRGEVKETDGKETPVWCGRALCAGICAICAVFCALWSLSGYAQREAGSAESTLDLLATMDRTRLLDPYNRNDYMLTYVLNVPMIGDDVLLARADQYAAKLSDVKSNTIGRYLVGYYLKRDMPEEAFDVALKSVEYTKSNPESWNEMFRVLEINILQDTYEADPAVYQNGVATLYERFMQVAAEQLDHPQLDAGCMTYIESIMS